MTDEPFVFDFGAFPKGKPLVLVVSGPSGVGKDAVLNKMKEMKFPFHFIVTMTTRTKRAAEVDGTDYFFITHEEFEERLKCGGFLEWAKVYGNYYGVPKDQVKKALEDGKDVVIKVDVQGAATIRKLLPDAIFVFLVPPSMEELARRLRDRKTESESDLTLRIQKAREELECITEFDYEVLNDNGGVDLAVKTICALMIAEKCKITPRHLDL